MRTPPYMGYLTDASHPPISGFRLNESHFLLPNCNTQTGKKNLKNRVHNCPNCGYQTNRDVAASQVIRNRGLVAVGQPVNENAFGDVLSGSISDWLDKSL